MSVAVNDIMQTGGKVHTELVEPDNLVALVRADWCKIAVARPKSSIRAGRDNISLDAIIGLKYGTCVEWQRSHKKLRILTKEEEEAASVGDPPFDATFTNNTDVELIEANDENTEDAVDGEDEKIDEDDETATESAATLSSLIHSTFAPLDNRLVGDDPLNAQRLTSDNIRDLRQQGSSGSDIVRQLVDNSATFQIKPVLTRDKYVRKKLSKHVLQFRVVRPTLQTVIQSYAATPYKISALRVDTVSYMLHRANVFAGGVQLVCDSVQGVLLGAVLDRSVQQEGNCGKTSTVIRVASHKGEECGRAFGFFGFSAAQQVALHKVTIQEIQALTAAAAPAASNDDFSISMGATGLLKHCAVDSLLIALRPDTHPKGIFCELFPFLGLSRPFAVHCLYHEPLAELFTWLKDGMRAARLQLEELTSIDYQVLPQRTHPQNVSQNCASYILSGIKIDSCGGNTVKKYGK